MSVPKKEKYKAGFTKEGEHLIETIDWLYDRDYSTDTSLHFLAYDANLYPCPNFSTWVDKYKQEHIDFILTRCRGWHGEIWLDDVKIKDMDVAV